MIKWKKLFKIKNITILRWIFMEEYSEEYVRVRIIAL